MRYFEGAEAGHICVGQGCSIALGMNARSAQIGVCGKRAAMVGLPFATWASGSLDSYPVEGLKAFEDRFTVNLITTPRAAFRTCAADEELATVLERNRFEQFDFLPVTESDSNRSSRPSQIIGLIELIPFLERAVHQNVLVKEHMRPLSEDNLIGADAGILSFVRDADRQRCRLVVSGRDLSGLVSLSDLQRLPARAALFTMVTHLEILMANFIRHEFAQSRDWLTLLSEGRQRKLRDEIDKSQKDDIFIDELLFTQLADKVTIIGKGAAVASNKAKFKKDLARVNALRDALAHANDYAANRDDARQVCETVRIMDYWIEQFGRWLYNRKTDEINTIL